MKDNERAASSKFGITQTELVSLINKYKARTYTEDIDWLEKVGGIEGMCDKLKTNLDTGLLPNDF